MHDCNGLWWKDQKPGESDDLIEKENLNTIIENTSKYIRKALETLSDRNYDIIIEHFGLGECKEEGFFLRVSKIKFKSKNAHQKAVYHALKSININLEKYLSLALNSREGDQQVLQEALNFVRGGNISGHLHQKSSIKK